MAKWIEEEDRPLDEFPLYMIELIFDIIGHSCKLQSRKLLENSRKAQVLGNHQLNEQKNPWVSIPIKLLSNWIRKFWWKKKLWNKIIEAFTKWYQKRFQLTDFALIMPRWEGNRMREITIQNTCYLNTPIVNKCKVTFPDPWDLKLQKRKKITSLLFQSTF